MNIQILQPNICLNVLRKSYKLGYMIYIHVEKKMQVFPFLIKNPGGKSTLEHMFGQHPEIILACTLMRLQVSELKI